MMGKIKGIIIFLGFLMFFTIGQSISYANSFVFNNKKNSIDINVKPRWLNIERSYFYDGETNDLTTGGHGFTALSQTKIENHFVNSQQPTFDELKKAKLNRYIDTKSGEGVFFGFQKQALTPLFDGRIAGTEILASLKNGDEKVTFLLQIPLDFDKKRPCIVAVPTTDADGVYNAKDMQIRGLWGLSRNCAVVYNDKGFGNILFDLTAKQGYLVNGQVANDAIAGNDLMLMADTLQADYHQYINRYAVKQLHSKQNPEEKWGQYVLNSIEFAFYKINEMFSPSLEAVFNKDNTLVLAYGSSDGGGAALKAGELDQNGIIDGIVAVNPQIQVNTNNQIPLSIRRGNLPVETLTVKSLIDYSSYAAIYMPCAVATFKHMSTTADIPYINEFHFSENRCQALKNIGLLTGNTFAEQANESMNKLYEYGWSPNMAYQLPYHYYNQSINLPYRYISQYGRYGVEEHLCDYSVASIDTEELYNLGLVKPLTNTNFAALWAQNNGLLPVKVNDRIVIDLVNDADSNSARREFYSSSADSKVVDYNLSGAICLRDKLSEKRVNDGLTKVLASGKLNQIKTIIVHGQLNVRNLPDYSSRAYAALNSYIEGSFSNLRYIEVENASYLDSRPPFDNTLIPIDYYGESAMNWLWKNLTKNVSLPDSQVIRAKARGSKIGLAPAINRDNLVPIMQTAKQNNRIILENGMIALPGVN